ncbi:hypothetical protein ACG7TL_005946 [Trametes sanguinea]
MSTDTQADARACHSKEVKRELIETVQAGGFDVGAELGAAHGPVPREENGHQVRVVDIHEPSAASLLASCVSLPRGDSTPGGLMNTECLSGGSSGNTFCGFDDYSEGLELPDHLPGDDEARWNSPVPSPQLGGNLAAVDKAEEPDTGDIDSRESSVGAPYNLARSLSSSDDTSSDESGSNVRLGSAKPARRHPYVEDADDDEQSSSDDDDNEPADPEDAMDVAEDDPLYTRLQDLVQDSGDVSATSYYATGNLPPALGEDSLVRRAYVQAFIAAAFHGATHDLINHWLNSQHQNFVSISRRAGLEIPGLTEMARTLRTVERRLGVDPDEHITYYALCTKCWARVTPRELLALPYSACNEPGCTGRFYSTKATVDGKRHRIPLKPLPTTSLIASVQRILLRPGKADELNEWRKTAGDKVGPVPHVPQEDWPGSESETYRMFDMFDGWGWRAVQAGLERRRGGKWGVEDISSLEILQRFVALPMGLILMFNIDWFRGLKRGKYSVGAIYCTICNNPRSKRFLREETILIAIIPGPEEPSLEQLNSVLEIFVLEAHQLYKAYQYREDNRYLKYAFRARYEDQATREEIADRRGIRWSILNILPDWLPARDSPPDFMHAGYLGEAKHVLQGILIKGGMFTKRSNANKPLDKFKDFLENVWLPGTFNKVPGNLLTGASGKADQWRIMTTYLPVALYVSWQVDGAIPDMDAPKPKAGEKAAAEQSRITALVNDRRHLHALQEGDVDPDDLDGMTIERADRNYIRHYETILEWCVAMRIWGSQSISVDEAWRAHECHMYACQTWARMLCHLTPYFHLLMHLVLWILRLGPVYAWWVFAYERFNGFLSKVRHNGHPGELEATMMRGWTKLHLIYDLILHLENLGEAKTPEDEESIKDLKACLQGPKKSGNVKGTLLMMLASMTAQHSKELIVFPKHGRRIDLKSSGLYELVYEHLRREWHGQIDLVFATVLQLRKGAKAADMPMSTAGNQSIFSALSNAADLGIDTWRARQLGELQAINVTQLSGHFALADIEYRGKLLWVTMSLCRHEHIEPVKKLICLQTILGSRSLRVGRSILFDAMNNVKEPTSLVVCPRAVPVWTEFAPGWHPSISYILALKPEALPTEGHREILGLNDVHERPHATAHSILKQSMHWHRRFCPLLQVKDTVNERSGHGLEGLETLIEVLGEVACILCKCERVLDCRPELVPKPPEKADYCQLPLLGSVWQPLEAYHFDEQYPQMDSRIHGEGQFCSRLVSA